MGEPIRQDAVHRRSRADTSRPACGHQRPVSTRGSARRPSDWDRAGIHDSREHTSSPAKRTSQCCDSLQSVSATIATPTRLLTSSAASWRTLHGRRLGLRRRGRRPGYPTVRQISITGRRSDESPSSTVCSPSTTTSSSEPTPATTYARQGDSGGPCSTTGGGVRLPRRHVQRRER